MKEIRHILPATAISFYAVTILICLFSIARSWKERVPLRGPSSVQYISLWMYFFLGGGFLISTICSDKLWMRVMHGSAAGVQFLVAVVLYYKNFPAEETRRRAGNIAVMIPDYSSGKAT